MQLKDLVYKNRTYRRFDESVEIDMAILEELIDLARVTSSAGNRQALKYVLVTDPQMRKSVFQNIYWARDLPDWPGPSEGERPTAYIIAFQDESISPNILWDLGLAVQSITLGAVERGLGGCQFGSFDRNKIKPALGIEDENLKPLMVLALGKPIEKVVLEEWQPGEEIKYYRDEDGTHFVPKRTLQDIVAKKI